VGVSVPIGVGVGEPVGVGVPPGDGVKEGVGDTTGVGVGLGMIVRSMLPVATTWVPIGELTSTTCTDTVSSPGVAGA
jgi:hypothetical protein